MGKKKFTPDIDVQSCYNRAADAIEIDFDYEKAREWRQLGESLGSSIRMLENTTARNAR